MTNATFLENQADNHEKTNMNIVQSATSSFRSFNDFRPLELVAAADDDEGVKDVSAKIS